MRACNLLLRTGIPLNNQSVLLRGVNDDIETMRALIHGLLRMRVRPYYLFQCDPVRGSEHFRTTIAQGIALLEQLAGTRVAFRSPPTSSIFREAVERSRSVPCT